MDTSSSAFPAREINASADPSSASAVTDGFDSSILQEPIDLWGWKGLTIVGTGIRAGLQTTPEAKICVEQASKVLYLVGDSAAETWIRSLNPTAESLYSSYESSKSRIQTYSEIVERVLAALRLAGDVCVVFYGHPGVLVNPSREAMKRARSEGFQVRMLPGVSAMDNLFSDLWLDPGITGLQSYEASDFLLHKPRFEPSAALILWQVGVVGERLWNPQSQPRAESLRALRDFLLTAYPAEHAAILYEAATKPFEKPVVWRVALSEIPDSKMSTATTILVPPLGRKEPDPEIMGLFHAGEFEALGSSTNVSSILDSTDHRSEG
jgi:precorrin-3B methylase